MALPDPSLRLRARGSATAPAGRFERLVAEPEADGWAAPEARLLRTELREGDLAARFGGEEFVLLLSHCNREQGLQFANRLRETVAAAQVMGVADPEVRVTVSLGIADSAHWGWGLDALLSAADAAMYQAKNAGRNRAVAALVSPD